MREEVESTVETEVGSFESLCRLLFEGAAFRPSQSEGGPAAKSCVRFIEPVAAAVAEIARVNERLLVDVTHRVPNLPSLTLTLATEESYGKYLVLNRFTTPDANALSPLGEVWGPSGIFGLRAVVLEAGRDRRGHIGRLSLVLPIWRTDAEELQLQALGVIGFDTRGYTSARIAWGTVYGPEGRMADVDRETTLECFYGLQRVEGLAGYTSSFFGITECLGFPGAEQALIGSLGSLAEYFRGVACEL